MQSELVLGFLLSLPLFSLFIGQARPPSPSWSSSPASSSSPWLPSSPSAQPHDVEGGRRGATVASLWLMDARGWKVNRAHREQAHWLKSGRNSVKIKIREGMKRQPCPPPVDQIKTGHKRRKLELNLCKIRIRGKVGMIWRLKEYKNQTSTPFNFFFKVLNICQTWVNRLTRKVQAVLAFYMSRQSR